MPDIGAKKLDLTGFVETLGPHLTTTDVEIRAKTMHLLSSTLANLDSDFLNAVQLNFITTFYCDRLKDHHSVIPNTLTGIEALIKMSNLPDECAGRLLQAIFRNVPCQSQVRDDRSRIFRIISELTKTKTKGRFEIDKNREKRKTEKNNPSSFFIFRTQRTLEHGTGFRVRFYKCNGW